MFLTRTILALTLTTSPLSAATIVAITADQSQQDNPATHAFDASPDTRWSAQGRGRWIQCELSEPVHINKIGLGFHHPERDYRFEIQISDDAKNWRPSTRSSSRAEPGVRYTKIDPGAARFVRITVDGSDQNDWANIHTISIPGVGPATPKPVAGPGGYLVTEWATGKEIANSVAISLDHHGNAYLTVARRRKQSSLDIRNHQDLVKSDLSLTTVEQRRAWYREHLTGKKWVPDRNGDGQRDWRDLTVQKDNVTRVSDNDRDGTAETLHTIGEFHSEVTGIAAGVLAVDNDLFVAAEPDFLRYTDNDGDGIPETRQLVATGFQVHMGQGGHNMSGVTLGPDGRIYWSLGDKGHYVETKEGKTYHMPNAGGIFRCELDGSNVERFSSGERNAQELAFDDHGNLFSMDNDGDYPGEMERALYITEGSEHGWRLNWQWLRKQDFTRISGLPAYNPWMDEKLFLPDREDHAAYLTPTLGNFGPGPCGFTRNPGTALSPDLADAFFMTNQKNEVRVIRFQPNGASFTFEEQPAIKGGNNNTGLAVGPDGALYAASYGSSHGAVYRFDVPAENRHPARAETQKILALESEDISPENLQAFLDHPDQRVRIKGQFELVRRNAFGKLQLAFMGGAKTNLGKIHAIWGLGQLARKTPAYMTYLLSVWDSAEPGLVAQAIKVIGDTPGTVGDLAAFREKILDGLSHNSPRVQFFSAITAGKRGLKAAIPKLVQMLETGASSDPYLRHAAVMGLAGTMSPTGLADLSSHRNRTVRLAAIVALRKLAAPETRAFLGDDDQLVLLEAARAIHDDASIPAALPDLSAVLDRDGLTNTALVRRAINAAFRNGTQTDLERLANYLDRNQGSPDLRRTALAAILWWSQPPVLDPVEGRYRKHPPRDPEPANDIVAKLKPAILADPDLREVLLNGVIERTQPTWLENTREHAPTWPASHQTRFLDALAKTGAHDLKTFVTASLTSPHPSVREKARQHARQAGVPSLDLLLAILADPDPAGQGNAVLQLARLEHPPRPPKNIRPRRRLPQRPRRPHLDARTPPGRQIHRHRPPRNRRPTRTRRRPQPRQKTRHATRRRPVHPLPPDRQHPRQQPRPRTHQGRL